MTILDQAIQIEGTPTKLAKALGVHRNNITNWRARGVPKGWADALRLRYQRKVKKLITAQCLHVVDSSRQD